MTGSDLARIDAYSGASLAERQQYAHAIAGAGSLLSQSVRAAGAAGVFLMAETGSMLGIHPIAALQGVHVIDGKPTLSANLLAALVRRAGHTLRVQTRGAWDAGTFIATATLIRNDDPDAPFVVEWTKERADRAGLLGKRGPWQQYPEAMCKSRAITEVIREGASDVTIIPAYSPEEMGGNVDASGELIVIDETRHASTTTDAPGPGVSTDAVQAGVEAIAAADSMRQLQGVWGDLQRVGLAKEPSLVEAKDARKAELAEPVQDASEAPGVVDAPEEPTDAPSGLVQPEGDGAAVTSWVVAEVPA